MHPTPNIHSEMTQSQAESLFREIDEAYTTRRSGADWEVLLGSHVIGQYTSQSLACGARDELVERECSKHCVDVQF